MPRRKKAPRKRVKASTALVPIDAEIVDSEPAEALEPTNGNGTRKLLRREMQFIDNLNERDESGNLVYPTVYAAAMAANYAEATAKTSIYRKLVDAGFQRARAKYELGKLDKARGLYELGEQQLRAYLRRPELLRDEKTRIGLALEAAKLGIQVKRDLGDTADVVDPRAANAELVAIMRRCMAAAIRATLRRGSSWAREYADRLDKGQTTP